jgi:hypothetical protein
MLLLNKTVKVCQALGNITCTISVNQTAIQIAHRITEYDFVTKKGAGQHYGSQHAGGDGKHARGIQSVQRGSRDRLEYTAEEWRT